MSENINVEDFFGSSNNKLVIANTFAIYHHDWDAIGEAIQNAVDSVLKKAEDASASYIPTIDITYNVRGHELIVFDNGLGIAPDEMKRIVAPHVSLKDRRGANRGEFGVGLTLVAFASNDFSLESVNNGQKAALKIMNGYSWAMDDSDKEDLQIVFDSKGATQEDSYTKVQVKPLRFREYTIAQLVYTLRRYTALGDFWSCVRGEDGRVKATLRYLDANGKETVNPVQNSLWHAGDNLNEIDQETVDWVTVEGEIAKPKDHTLPNWIGYGLIDKGTLTASGKEFAYYALFCRPGYYRQLSELIGYPRDSEETEEENDDSPSTQAGEEPLTGIFVCKKGMPLGAIVDHPKTSAAGYWRDIVIVINCDDLTTEPGRKRLHIPDEELVRSVSKKIFTRLIKYAHYIIPRDPDEEMDSLLRNLDKTIQNVRRHREDHRLVNEKGRINIYVEPMNEQTVIALFHEMIGAGLLGGYKALRLSASDTYDGVYEYEIDIKSVGKDHLNEWLRQFPAKEREKITTYHVEDFVVEFKMRLQDVIKDFLQKTKYHPNIKLIVAWDADESFIRRRGWLLEPLPKPRQKFHGAAWRLRPSSEGQARGILATDVLLLKEYLGQKG